MDLLGNNSEKLNMKMGYRKQQKIFPWFALMGLLLSFGVSAGEKIKVTDAWVRAVPPVAANSAAYFQLHNSSEKEIKLQSVNSAAARVVEIHEVIHKDGLSTMQPVKSVVIPAGGKVSFEPAGYHVMLIGLKQPVKEGDKVALDFSFSADISLSVEADVKFSQEMSNHEHHHQH